MKAFASLVLAAGCGFGCVAAAATGPRSIGCQTLGGDFYATYDDATGVLTLVRDPAVSDPEWKYVNVRRYGFFDGKFLTAADLDGDGGQDVVLPGFAANKVLVVWSRSYTSRDLSVEAIATGPGPAAVAPAQLDGTVEQEALVATLASAQVQVRGWDFRDKQPVVGPASFPEGFAQGGILGFQTAGASRGARDPALGILRRDAGEESGDPPVFEIFTRDPAPAYGPANSIRLLRMSRGYTDVISGHFNGETQPGWFLVWGPGLSSVEIIPSTTVDNHETITLHGSYDQVVLLPDVDDQVLVVFENGSMEIYDWPGEFANRFDGVDQVDPPAGMRFVTAAGVKGGFLALAADGTGRVSYFGVYEKGASGFGLAAQGAWPASPSFGTGVTVVLYTANPFSTPPPFPFETFLAGDWASAVSYSAGSVMASVETFGGSDSGLSNPTPQTLVPANDPGPASVALGNQWEPTSSLFHDFGAAAADGAASVTIDPPPGAFPNTIAVMFQTGAGVTAHYRVQQGVWLSGPGPVWLTQDATIEYYGEHIGGALSSIQTAVYEIEQSFGADSDGDSVPDAIEVLAGSNPFNRDSDGDRADDFSEIVGGSDPNDPSIRTATLEYPNLTFFVPEWDDTNSAALPALGQDLLVTSWLHRYEFSAGKYASWDYNFETPRSSTLHKLWLPANYRIDTGRVAGPAGAAMASLGGVPVSTALEIPLDLSTADPLAAWREAAWDAVEARAAEPLRFTIGPASTMAALLFEYWYGARLVELGRLPSLADRPHLADTPRSPSAGVPLLEDIAAIQSPQGQALIAHELAHVVQQVNSNVVNGAAFGPLRDTAEAVYAQAIQANQNRMPLPAPIEALRGLISGMALPPGYTSPHPTNVIQDLRNQALTAVLPRPVRFLSGTLTYVGEVVAVESQGVKYVLFKVDGTPLRSLSPAGGFLVQGATANITIFVLPGTLPGPKPGEVLFKGEVVFIEPTFVPSGSDFDEDGNGLPDSWQLAFIGRLGTPFGHDADGDGFLDPEEYAARTDPKDALSTPGGLPATPVNFRVFVGTADQPVVEWDGSFSADYQLRFTTDLADWLPYPGVPQRSGDRRHTMVIQTSKPSEYFQLLTTIPLPGER